MATVKKNIFTICFESDENSKVVYTAGKFFNVTESGVSPMSTAYNPLLEDLAYSLKNFNVTEEGLSFYYDLKSKSIKKITEGIASVELQQEKINESVESFNKLIELNEKLSEVESLRREHKLAGNEAAVSEAINIISEIQASIAKVKETATVTLYRYVAEENKVYVNNTETTLENFTEDMFAAGYINYADKAILKKFEAAANNFDKYSVAENLTEITEDSITVSTFRVNEKAFVYKNNVETTITEFKELSAVAAIDYISEKTGEDVSFMFEDVLQAKLELRSRLDAKIEETLGLIAFLKDQRNILAEANKNIPEIKEADKLISSEIANFETIISILENDKLTRNDGYTTATLRTEYEGVEAGTEVKVDALDYTTAGKDDIITIVSGDKTIKVEKRHVEISSKETI
jgi:hypothetical protein